MGNIRVLVVDDSAFARLAVSRTLQAGEGITVIDFARDGVEALEKIKLLKPDVVTLDVEMPVLDGLGALRRIISECPVPVVMLSSLTSFGAEATMKALEIGAVDFFQKHSLSNPVGSEENIAELRNKVMMASRVKVTGKAEVIEPVIAAEKPKKTKANFEVASRLVIIGSSTGGPKALYQVIPKLPGDIPAAIIVVQHMPPGFTNSLANRLDQLSSVLVKEAASGDVLYNGVTYVARGGYHLLLEQNGILAFNQAPAVNGVRPSVDVTMQSAVKVYGSSILGVVLTGMGSDGTRGAQHIKVNGGKVIVEDESTCVVWGMPRSVAEAGYADEVLPLPQIAGGVVDALKAKVEE